MNYEEIIKKINLNEVELPLTRFPKGGYICEIKKAEQYTTKNGNENCLKINYDIAEGDYKDYFQKQLKQRITAGDLEAEYRGIFYKSFSEKALPFFKEFITAIENSNKDFKGIQSLENYKNMLIGIVFSEEEYKNTNGEIRLRLYNSSIVSVKDITEGNYTVKELKKLPKEIEINKNLGDFEGFEELTTDEDLPF